MNGEDLKQYCEEARTRGATAVKLIHPSTVVTAPWVRWKCQFGCAGYGKSFCCPPNTPTPDETRKLLDAYRRAILFHIEAPRTPERGKQFMEFFEMMIALEGDLFKGGYYKALVMLAGPCNLSKECGKTKGSGSCNFGGKARPSMEACGIDVFQTARNHGFFIQTLREKRETQNIFSLLLVD